MGARPLCLLRVHPFGCFGLNCRILRLQLYSNRKFNVHHRLLLKMASISLQERILHVFERTIFPFVEGYLAARTTLQLDRPVVYGLDWVPSACNTKRVIQLMRMGTSLRKPRRHSRSSREGGGSRHFWTLQSRESGVCKPLISRSTKISRSLSAVSCCLTTSDSLEDVYGSSLDDVWEIDADDSGATTSGHCKEFRSQFNLHRHLLLKRDELKVPSFLYGVFTGSL